MKPRDWFTIGVRVLGVWVWLAVFDDIRTLLDIRLGYFSPTHTPVVTYFMIMVQHVGVGSYLLFLGHHLAGLIYREPAAEEAKSAEARHQVDPTRPAP